MRTQYQTKLLGGGEGGRERRASPLRRAVPQYGMPAAPAVPQRAFPAAPAVPARGLNGLGDFFTPSSAGITLGAVTLAVIAAALIIPVLAGER